MKTIQQLNRVFFTLGACVAVVACGGGGGGSSTSATAQTGQFVDSPVAGLRYSTATQSGTTNAAGEYKYLPNETVTFSIGNVIFPAVPASGIVTPLDIFSTGDSADRRVVNLLVLLQSLDEDGDPRNGIKIPAGATAAAASPVNFDVPYASFAANGAVTTLIANSGSVTRAPVSDTAARAHFNEILTGTNGATRVNIAPRAAAGIAQSVRQGSNVQLAGTGADANLDALTYSWAVTSAPAGVIPSLVGGSTLNPTFIAANEGVYTLTLTVSDGVLTSTPSTVTITAAAVPAVAVAALSAQGTLPTLSASNCTAVQAVSNVNPGPFADADMQQANDILAAVDPSAYAIFKKLPDTFAFWLRGNYGSSTVNLANLEIALHETSHGVQNVNSFRCGPTAFKYLLDNNVYTTDLVSNVTALYSIVSQTYPLTNLPSRYNIYIAPATFPSGNDARILLDELTAYATAARLSINLVSAAEYRNFTVSQDGDLAGMADFMLFTQSYIKAVRLSNPSTYTALQSANTKAYIQTLWTFAEQTLTRSLPYAYSASSATFVTGKPLFVNKDVLANIYSVEWLAELDSLGITHKTASDFSGALTP